MTLHLIGIGLWDAKDISIRAKEVIQSCKKVYLESYTSALHCEKEDLEKEWKVKITLANREFVESGKQILEDAKKGDIALLIIGDVFAATTHTSLLVDAKENNININILHNASVLTAIGITGLELYKFGQTTSIPFDNKNITTPLEILEKNQSVGLHTLFLLDLHPEEKKFLKASDAAKYLLEKGVKNQKAIACAALGGPNPIIKVDTLEKLKEEDIDEFPQCLLIPGNLHFMEEEAIS